MKVLKDMKLIKSKAVMEIYLSDKFSALFIILRLTVLKYYIQKDVQYCQVNSLGSEKGHATSKRLGEFHKPCDQMLCSLVKILGLFVSCSFAPSLVHMPLPGGNCLNPHLLSCSLSSASPLFPA